MPRYPIAGNGGTQPFYGIQVVDTLGSTLGSAEVIDLGDSGAIFDAGTITLTAGGTSGSGLDFEFGGTTYPGIDFVIVGSALNAVVGAGTHANTIALSGSSLVFANDGTSVGSGGTVSSDGSTTTINSTGTITATGGSPARIWRDETSSRAAGVGYTNSSATEMEVQIQYGLLMGQVAEIYLSGTLFSVIYNGNAVEIDLSITATVPVLTLYTLTQGGGAAFTAWKELSA